MGTDLDALDEIFSEPAAKRVRTGVKFQPKAKPRPRKESSAVDVGEKKKPSLVSETLKNEESLKNKEDSVSGVLSYDRAVVHPSLEHFVAGESLGSGAGLPSDVSPDVNGLHFTIGKSAGECADIFSGLESLDGFYSQSTTTSTVGAANRSPKGVDLSVHLGNDLSTSCPVNKDAEGILAHSEIPTVRDSDTRSVEEEPVIPVVSHLSVSAVGVSNASSPYPSADLTIAQDPLTCGDSASCESGVPHINTRCVEIEDAEANPCLETLFELTTQSGQRRGKFKPKPKAQTDRDKPGGMTSRPQGYESVPCSQNAQYVPSESEYINEASIPAMPTNDLLNFSSLRFDDTSSQIPEIEEPMYPGETSEKIVSPRTKSRKRKRRKVPVVSSDHQQASISGPENEADDDENYVNESPSGSHIHEDESFDGKLQELKTTKKRKVPRKSTKSATQKEKPVRKRKKAKEVPDPASKEPPGKFSHSTKRKRRQVDKALLDTPEDEIDVTKLCMRDLILLAEHRERISSKEGKTSEVTSTMHSAGTSYAGYNEDETFASEQGGFSDDQTIPIALRQFGSDISMIQQLFPGRSRTQVKLKYKKEERQNPLRLHEALTTRSKGLVGTLPPDDMELIDHTHFQLVIEHLKEVAAQEKENSCRDDSTGFPGDEEEEEVAKSEQAEEGVKQAEEGEVEATEPDITEVHSPTKSCDTEDDLSRWSQYKSEL
ncbi:hypothetical protein RHMOL_Rhmol01G0114600 [Rhododendron molle]|uniref:Uncharacterized protein n=1 Tax=Rhododendron molle TaxID=49168 RepID=A0ACC0Q1R7_RHOML|nr:hypothetical protein RHMOL_Rhmol01G0114600 [Rhododendron molle]